jgi:hypothetical protein
MEKATVQALLDSFDGDIDVDAFLGKLTVLDDIERSERQITAGDTVPHESVLKSLERWAG